MTIDSVAVTRTAVYNGATNEARIPSTNVSGSIDLTIDASPIANRLVQCGVPFYKGHVSNINELVLLNENEQEISAQFDILTTWPDGSIHTVLITAYVAPDPVNSKQYRLNYGAGVIQNAYSTNLSLVDNANDYTIETGKIKVVIDKTTGQIIKSVHLDTAGNQTYSTQMTGQSDIISQDAEDDVIYYASNETAPTLKICRNGVMNIQIQSVGYLRDVSNNTYTEFRVWIDLFNDSDEMEVMYTMVDKEPRTDKNLDPGTGQEPAFQCRNLKWTFDHNISSNHQYIFGGEVGNIASNATGSFNSEVYLTQSGEWLQNINGAVSTDPSKGVLYGDDESGYYQKFGGVIAGSKAKGYATLHNGTIGITAMFKEFWERHPRELALDTTAFEVGCFPERHHTLIGNGVKKVTDIQNDVWRRASTLHYSQAGMAMTYEFKLKFHVATPVASDIENCLDDYKQFMPKLMCTADHYCRSGFIYDLVPKDSNSSNYYDGLLTSRLLFPLSEHPARNRVAGWRDFGDRNRGDITTTYPARLSGWYNGTHIGGINYGILFIATLEKEWFTELRNETFLFMDTLVRHSDYIKTGSPPGSIRVTAHAHVDHYSPHEQFNHIHISGLLPFYWFTGNQRAYEVMQEIGSYRSFHEAQWYPSPRPAVYSSGNRAYHEAEREFGFEFYAALQYVKISNDAEYFKDSIKRRVTYALEWWKTPVDHYIRNEIVGTMDHTLGTGYWNHDKMDNSGGSYGNSVIPWMLGMKLQHLIQYHDMELEYQSGIDLIEFRQMLYQAMQFCFDWGYDEAAHQFYYSAAVTQYYGGSAMLLSPFAWLYLKYQEDLNLGNISNPEWFNPTQWKTSLLVHWERMKPLQWDNYRYGFYGYELLFPGWFWKLMPTIENE